MPYSLVHRLAVALIIVTIIVTATAFFIASENLAPMPMRIGQTMLVSAFWGFLALKVWKRPRTWSLGVALLITASFLMQVYMWFTTSSASASRFGGRDLSDPSLLLLRAPAVLAAACCFWLFWLSRKVPGRDEAPRIGG